MWLAKRNKLLFIHIPRNAGKSVVNAMKRGCKGIKKVEWEHARLKDIARKMDIKPYVKFAVVRNPWERMVSLWSFLSQHKLTYETRTDKVRDVKELEEIGFSKWLLKYGKKSRGIVTTDTPQTNWLKVKGKIATNYIIKYENLQTGFKNVTGIDMKLPMTHKSSHKDYREYYTEESKAYIDKVFAEDIELFKYEF